MGASAILNRLEANLDVISARVTDGRRSFPSKGFTLDRFGLAMLSDVSPEHWSIVTAALERRGAVWVGRAGGVWKVYPERPEGLTWALSLTPSDELLAQLAPHVGAIWRALRIAHDSSSENDCLDARDDAYRAARKFVIVCGKAVAKSRVTLDDVRSFIMPTLAARIVAVIIHHEPALDPSSHAPSFESEANVGPRIDDQNATLAEKAFNEIERRGRAGTTRSDLFRSVRPIPTADYLTEALDSLVDGGMVDVVRMKGRGSHMTTHYVPKACDGA